ncbi:hypothetical protein [Jannaschia sp. CCS1]|uniref:hypothetical protein n=1 Tax=Jannaschia sp. (strain CCS1) TaxID=290400 RepID=UPI0002F4943D|nr:hypothetical protein [Jannaschia sp. CCS1]
MEPTNPLTLLDYWPLFALGALALLAVVVVFRGIRRPPDGSKNKSNIGGGPGGD